MVLLVFSNNLTILINLAKKKLTPGWTLHLCICLCIHNLAVLYVNWCIVAYHVWLGVCIFHEYTGRCHGSYYLLLLMCVFFSSIYLFVHSNHSLTHSFNHSLSHFSFAPPKCLCHFCAEQLPKVLVYQTNIHLTHAGAVFQVNDH